MLMSAVIPHVPCPGRLERAVVRVGRGMRGGLPGRYPRVQHVEFGLEPTRIEGDAEPLGQTLHDRAADVRIGQR